MRLVKLKTTSRPFCARIPLKGWQPTRSLKLNESHESAATLLGGLAHRTSDLWSSMQDQLQVGCHVVGVFPLASTSLSAFTLPCGICLSPPKGSTCSAKVQRRRCRIKANHLTSNVPLGISTAMQGKDLAKRKRSKVRHLEHKMACRLLEVKMRACGMVCARERTA